MRLTSLLISTCALAWLSACGQQEPDTELAAGSQTASSSAETDHKALAESVTKASNLSPEQLLKKGNIVFLRCRSCHTLDEGGMNLTGPNLYGLFGAKAGSKKTFAYSAAVRNSNITWNADTLNAWLENPQGVITGNVMVFQGLPKQVDRDALIAYLRKNTQQD